MNVSLDEVLTAVVPPGVHLWDADGSAAEIEGACAAARAAGWEVVVVPAGPGDGVQRLLAALGPALGLPEHYGANLDALHDCLAERAGSGAAPTLLVGVGWWEAAATDRARWAGLLDVLREHAAGPPRLEVLLAGPAPQDPGLPRLISDLAGPPGDRTGGAGRAGAVTLVLGTVALAATAYAYVLSLSDVVDPPNWLRAIGLAGLPVGILGTPVAFALARVRGRRDRWGLAAAAVALTAFVALVVAKG